MPPSEALSTAAASGDTGATLRALRDILAAQIEDPGTPPRDMAALAGRLESVLERLDRLPPAVRSVADELKAVRDARRPAASAS